MKKKPEAIPWEKVRKELLSDPEVKKAYDDFQPEFAIVQAIVDAKVKKNVTQQELAKRMGTGQAVISRLENAKAKPSLSLIQRLADALNLKVKLIFTPK